MLIYFLYYCLLTTLIIYCRQLDMLGRPAHLVAPGRPVLPNPVPPPLSPSHVMPRVAIMGNASNGEAHCSKKKIDSRSK